MFFNVDGFVRNLSFPRRRESRVNVSSGKNWIPDQVRNDKIGIFRLYMSSSYFMYQEEYNETV